MFDLSSALLGLNLTMLQTRLTMLQRVVAMLDVKSALRGIASSLRTLHTSVRDMKRKMFPLTSALRELKSALRNTHAFLRRFITALRDSRLDFASGENRFARSHYHFAHASPRLAWLVIPFADPQRLRAQPCVSPPKHDEAGIDLRRETRFSNEVGSEDHTVLRWLSRSPPADSENCT